MQQLLHHVMLPNGQLTESGEKVHMYQIMKTESDIIYYFCHYTEQEADCEQSLSGEIPLYNSDREED